jgi:hypothetical protein
MVTAPFRVHKTHKTRLLLSKTEFVNWTKEMIGQTFIDDNAGEVGDETAHWERTEQSGEYSDEDDDDEFHIDLDTSVGRVAQFSKNSAYPTTQLNYHSSVPSKSLTVATLGAVTSKRFLQRSTADGIEVDWFNSPVKIKSPRSSPKMQSSLTFSVEKPSDPLRSYRSPTAFSFDSPVKALDGDNSSPLSTSANSEIEQQQVFFAATTASRIRQSTGLVSSNSPSLPTRKASPSPSPVRSAYSLSPMRADVSAGNATQVRETEAVMGGKGTNILATTEDLHPDDESDSSVDTMADHSPYLASGLAEAGNGVSATAMSCLCGVTSSVFNSSGFSLTESASENCRSSTEPFSRTTRTAQHLLYQKAVVVDIDICQVKLTYVQYTMEPVIFYCRSSTILVRQAISRIPV